MARTQCEQIQKANTLLNDEITELKQESIRLNKELASIKKIGDIDILSTEQYFRDLISKRDSEIRLLQEIAEKGPLVKDIEISRLADMVIDQREYHLTEVNALKARLQKTQDTHHGYWEKLTDVLEVSYSAREAEVEKLNDMLKWLEDEKDAEIQSCRY